jgi:hypothetical protein
MMTQRTLLVLCVCRPVPDIKSLWVEKCEKDLTPIAAAKQAGDSFFGKIIGGAFLRCAEIKIRLDNLLPSAQP